MTPIIIKTDKDTKEIKIDQWKLTMANIIMKLRTVLYLCYKTFML